MPVNRANYGISFQHSGIQEAREAIRLLRDSFGNLLGPIGELTRLLGNPVVEGFAGAMLAIKLYSEQIEAAEKNTAKLITASREIHEAFRQNMVNAILRVKEELAQFNQEYKHAADIQNQFQLDMEKTIASVTADTEAVKKLVEAQKELTNEIIRGKQIRGEITPGEAGHEAEAERKAARARQEGLDKAKEAAEIGAKRTAAEGAAREAMDLRDQANDPSRTKSREVAEALQANAKTQVDDLRKQLIDANDALDSAKAREGPTAEDIRITAEIQKNPMMAAWYATNDPIGTGFRIYRMGKARAVADAQQRKDTLQPAFDAQTQRLSEASIRQKNLEDETKRIQDQAAEKEKFSQETERAADAQDALFARKWATGARPMPGLSEVFKRFRNGEGSKRIIDFIASSEQFKNDLPNGGGLNYLKLYEVPGGILSALRGKVWSGGEPGPPEGSQAKLDKTQDEALRQKWINDLRAKGNAGTLTPDELLQLQAAQAVGPSGRSAQTGEIGQTITETWRTVSGIGRDVRAQGGFATAEQLRQLAEIQDIAIGLQHHQSAQTDRAQSALDALLTRVQALENTHYSVH